MITDEGMRPGLVIIEHGRIVEVVDAGWASGDMPVDELADAVLMPGLVDSHVHVNEPGRTQWEGFETATRAAAAGSWTCR